MNVPEHNLALLRQARGGIERFAALNREQQKLKALLLTMLGYMERVFCRPGEGREFARWWATVREYWQVLESPELESASRRTVLAELLGDEDEEPCDEGNAMSER